MEQEYIAPELLPAVNTAQEVHDLRLIIEADNKDIMDWVETAVEMLPEISTEIKQIIDSPEDQIHNQKNLPERAALIVEGGTVANEDISANSLFLKSMDQ